MADLSNLSEKKKRDIEALIEMVRGMSVPSNTEAVSNDVVNNETSFEPSDFLPTKEQARNSSSVEYSDTIDEMYSDGQSDEGSSDGWTDDSEDFFPTKAEASGQESDTVVGGESDDWSSIDVNLPTKEEAKKQESDMFVETTADGWSDSGDGWSDSGDGWSDSGDGWSDGDGWLEEDDNADYSEIKDAVREEHTNHIQSDIPQKKPKKPKIVTFPMSQIDIDNGFNSELQQVAEELKDEGNATEKTTSFDDDFVKLLKSAGFYDKRKEASRSKNVERKVNSQVLYKEDTLTDYNGNPKEYKRVICNANWGSGFYDNLSNENCLKNLGMLRREVTQSILNYFGSWERIHDIYVEDDILVINGFAYTPKLLNMDANISKFPLDTYEYIKTGRIAPLFDWSVMNYMSNLRVLSLQTYDFANDVVANDLDMDFFRIATFFSSLPKLQIIHIEGQTIDRNKPKEKVEDDEETTVYEHMNNSLNLRARISEAFGNYNFNIYTATNAGQDFFVNSLRDYAKNRGNKGFLRYSAGVVGRFVGATAATTLNAGLHLIGGVAKGLFKTFKDAMTPIDNP